ncbi:sensor histidine kinase [Planctobacterium marinum]|uniref:sensor histidine kinase n=1 Tax=Planctobacterium marinum TaxID=1631968 RepID=UPI0030C745BA
MNDAIGRLKNWRILIGSSVILLIQALLSFNLKFHAENIFLQSLDSWLNAAATVFYWYFPAILAAPFLVAFAPLTRANELGWLRFTIFNCLFVVSATLLIQISSMAILHYGLAQDWQQGSFSNMVGYFYRNTPWHADLILIFALFAFGYAFDYSQRLRNKELEEQRLKAELLNAELQTLKSQLNPHFLFNVLNGISGLIRVGRHEDATDSLSDLSVMLRTILENRDTELVTVKDELDFIELYLALQQMRFNDKLEVNINCDNQVLKYKLPFMVMQPLVENAIQHGAQLETAGNVIDIKLFQEKDKLHFEVTNRVPKNTSESGFGIGVGNNRARLERIYGQNYSLELKALPERYFLTSLIIPVNVV